jgi:sortase A
MQRRTSALFMGLIILMTAWASTALMRQRADAGSATGGDDPRLVAPVTTSTTTEPPTSTTVPKATTTTVAPLPQPESPPDDPYADVPVRRIGTISIPKIGLQHDVFEGIWLTVLDVGPGHWPGSAMPGRRGNAVFPGHRVTHTHPFLDIDQLAPGDEVTFTTADGTFTYAVTGTQIVVPTDMWVVDQTNEKTMTLIACHPKHSARQRIVVKGNLVRSEPSPAAASGARDAGRPAQRLGV